MQPVVAAGIWPGVEQGMAQRGLCCPPCPGCGAHSCEPLEGMDEGWLECSAVGMWGWDTHGSHFPMATGVEPSSLWLYREQTTGHGQVFKLPGDFALSGLFLFHS